MPLIGVQDRHATVQCHRDTQHVVTESHAAFLTNEGPGYDAQPLTRSYEVNRCLLFND